VEIFVVSETTNPGNVIDMQAFRANQSEPEALPENKSELAEVRRFPVVADHGGRPHVRTIGTQKRGDREITFNPLEQDYTPQSPENIAPEAEELFKAALDIMKARAAVTDILTQEEQTAVSDAAYIELLAEQNAPTTQQRLSSAA